VAELLEHLAQQDLMVLIPSCQPLHLLAAAVVQTADTALVLVTAVLVAVVEDSAH
jgi:hypothetical protein